MMSSRVASLLTRAAAGRTATRFAVQRQRSLATTSQLKEIQPSTQDHAFQYDGHNQWIIEDMVPFQMSNTNRLALGLGFIGFFGLSFPYFWTVWGYEYPEPEED